INAGIVQKLATDIAKYAPKAFILVISNPVNSTVPIVAEVLKKYNVFDPKRLYGVTTLDIVRASTFISSISGADPREIRVPVVGGHSGVTIIPLLSQVSPSHKFTQEQIASLTKRIQFGNIIGRDFLVAQTKDGTGSATLSMAHAGAVFASYIFDATIKGKTANEYTTFANLVGEPQVRVINLPCETETRVELIDAAPSLDHHHGEPNSISMPVEVEIGVPNKNPDGYLKPLDVVWVRKAALPGVRYWHVGVYLGDEQVCHFSSESKRRETNRTIITD
ncbi:6830_t:CDS:2, partial [Entrophospora sp. SA101]